VLRPRGTAQAASEALPVTELFLYGGLGFGSTFSAATLAGDSGIAGSAELAWRLPEASVPSQLQGSEIYSFIDSTWVWNELRGVLLLPKGRAASAGIGLRAHVMEKVQLQVEPAAIIENPRYTAGRDGWRLVFGVRSLL
jgi:hemolysin activation/secretion protein